MFAAGYLYTFLPRFIILDMFLCLAILDKFFQNMPQVQCAAENKSIQQFNSWLCPPPPSHGAPPCRKHFSTKFLCRLACKWHDFPRAPQRETWTSFGTSFLFAQLGHCKQDYITNSPHYLLDATLYARKMLNAGCIFLVSASVFCYLFIQTLS